MMQKSEIETLLGGWQGHKKKRKCVLGKTQVRLNQNVSTFQEKRKYVLWQTSLRFFEGNSFVWNML